MNTKAWKYRKIRITRCENSRLYPYCIVLFTAKTGCDAIKNKRCLQTLESIPKLAVGRPKKPSGYLVDTPRISQDNKKQRKRIKQEHQKIRTKVHQY